ncbi:hypothetical protein GK047_24325 [Paenibacillus sp. SYP-B3998]|uniref:Uncharacterized protein n=1 Tax=Paenibacillus sp. SYP-B3998 TaxID=2678564 RepID=A0A6G4A3N0_9BACL|nr:hypothetical protein [Paenibacillus sp. SYP-B3998]NEW09106.1 hypothetical protein [Paenibacillus sp. SYP-B3998]
MSQLTVVALRKAARKSLPIYLKIALSPLYAARLTLAIRNANLNTINRLFKEVTSGFNSVGSNTFGFSIQFAAPAPANEVGNATNTKGNVRLTVSSLRSISKRVLRLYGKISRDNAFATQLVQAAKVGNNIRLRALITPLLPSNSLVAVQGDRTGIVLQIKSSTGVVFISQFFVL